MSQITPNDSSRNSPSAASHASASARGLKPSPTATATTNTPLISDRISLPSTCPVSTDVRAIGMVRNLAMMPSVMSVEMLMAVASALAHAVIKMMPGVR